MQVLDDRTQPLRQLPLLHPSPFNTGCVLEVVQVAQGREPGFEVLYIRAAGGGRLAGGKKGKERETYFEVLLVLLRLGGLSVHSFAEIIKANGYDRDEAEGWPDEDGGRERGQKANAYRFGSGFSFTAFSQTSAGTFGGLPYRCT